MSLSIEPEAEVEKVKPKRQMPRVRARWAIPLGIAFVVLSGLGLAFGLLRAAKEIKAPAAAARAELTAMKDALKQGDEKAAAAALERAHKQLDRAKSAAGRPSVRIARFMPVLSTPVSDLRHLMSAADDLVNGGDQVLALYENMSGADSKLFDGTKFDMAEVHRAKDAVDELMALLGSAEKDLKAVRGGRFAPGAVEARDGALSQIATLRKDAEPLVNILGVLPAALGENGQRTYVVVLQNQAELRAGGGAPLNLMAMQFDKGEMKTLTSGNTADLDGNNAWVWEPVKGNEAWHKAGQKLPFASANYSPDWQTSGEELARAYEVMTGTRADGVIGIDVSAMAAVLRVTGSITTEGYGELTADTLAKVLLVDAYRRFPNFRERRAHNAEVMSGMVSRMIGGGQLAGKMRALTSTASAGHFQLYFRDPQLSKLVAPTAMAGHLDPGTGDFAAVYTTNRNASKVDAFQTRTIRQDVVVQADGSASVTRTVTITNNTSGYVPSVVYPRDHGKGYRTTFSDPVLSMYVPPGGRVRGFDMQHSPRASAEKRPWANDRTMRVMHVSAHLGRGHSLTTTLKYLTRVPKQPLDEYRLRIASQPLLLPAQMVVSVRLPAGFTAQPQPGWKQQGDAWVATFPVERDVDIVLPYTRG